MSVYDILESVWNFASTWPIPAGTPDVYGAVGTTQTCAAQGFLLDAGRGRTYLQCLFGAFVLLGGQSGRVRRHAATPSGTRHARGGVGVGNGDGAGVGVFGTLQSCQSVVLDCALSGGLSG